MAFASGLRLPADPTPANDDLDPVEIILDGMPEPDVSAGGKIELGDGSVVINFGPPKAKAASKGFDENLAEWLPDSELARIADELLRAIDEDEMSRKEWLANRAAGIKLLGLTIEEIRSLAGDPAALEGMSQYRSTILLEALIRFHSNAMAELLPADGPFKVRQDDPLAGLEEDDLADALERDMNHYVTRKDKAYVPDTDAMLWKVGLDGSAFKKVYHDPIKKMPLARAVDAVDIIVSNNASSIADAGRITHRTRVRPSMARRMQLLGEWRDVPLLDPGYVRTDEVQAETEHATGLKANTSFEPRDRRYEIYECYCELEIEGDEQEEGLAVPYRVTIERESQQILAIRRNWEEGDDMYMPKDFFVQYVFIRGFGFYGIGLSHIMGNTTNALTAITRELIDGGMFANFPGFLIAKDAARQNTNELRVPPGGGKQIDTGGRPIQDVAMPLPYKSPDAGFMQFAGALEQTGARVGGTTELQVGEGRQDAPVGTTLALIEQAIKPQMAVHRRLHAAQAEEMGLLIDRLREDPEAFWRGNKKPAKPWDRDLFLQALNDYELVPQADPNTASHLQRVMRNAGLVQFVQADPQAAQVYDLMTVRRTVIKGLGFGQPAQFFSKLPIQAPPPDPKAQAALIAAQANLMNAQQKQQQLAFSAQNLTVENENRDKDREAKVAVARMQMQRTAISAAAQQQHARDLAAAKIASDHIKHMRDLQHSAQTQMRDHAAQRASQGLQLAHDRATSSMQRLHDAHMQGLAAVTPAAPIPGARLAPDGKHYVQHPATKQWYRYDPKPEDVGEGEA